MIVIRGKKKKKKHPHFGTTQLERDKRERAPKNQHTSSFTTRFRRLMSAGLPYGLQAMLKVLLLLVPHACVDYAFDASSVLLFFFSLSLNARRRVVFIVVVVFIIIIIIFVCVLLVQSQRRLDDDDVDEMSFARC